ncbi:MAG TPA: diguanylate cyclase [Dehalococcoidia bacterium]|nr:diguanylate cyclase [Dehalococcoidia bacterium]
MSLAVARQKRAALHFAVLGALLAVGAVSVISARDQDGVMLRVGMVLLVLGAAMWLGWFSSVLAGALIWLLPNLLRSFLADTPLFGMTMMLELPGVLALAACANLARHYLQVLEEEALLMGRTGEELAGFDELTGSFDQRLLAQAVEFELARSRRFNRDFALVLVGLDPLRQKFDYRDPAIHAASFTATAQLLGNTRKHIDRLYRYGKDGFALILPESNERDVSGLTKRLRGLARRATPREGEPGGPMPVNFGASFFPNCATTADDLLRRANVALKIAEGKPDRVYLDSADAADAPPPETLRRPEDVEIADEAVEAIEPVAAVAVTTVAQPEKPVAVVSSLPAMDELLRESAKEAEVAAGEAHEAAVQSAKRPPPPPVEYEPIDFTDIFKRLDETIEMLKSVRENKPAAEPKEPELPEKKTA